MSNDLSCKETITVDDATSFQTSVVVPGPSTSTAKMPDSGPLPYHQFIARPVASTSAHPSSAPRPQASNQLPSSYNPVAPNLYLTQQQLGQLGLIGVRGQHTSISSISTARPTPSVIASVNQQRALYSSDIASSFQQQQHPQHVSSHHSIQQHHNPPTPQHNVPRQPIPTQRQYPNLFGNHQPISAVRNGANRIGGSTPMQQSVVTHRATPTPHSIMQQHRVTPTPQSVLHQPQHRMSPLVNVSSDQRFAGLQHAQADVLQRVLGITPNEFELLSRTMSQRQLLQGLPSSIAQPILPQHHQLPHPTPKPQTVLNQPVVPQQGPLLPMPQTTPHASPHPHITPHGTSNIIFPTNSSPRPQPAILRRKFVDAGSSPGLKRRLVEPSGSMEAGTSRSFIDPTSKAVRVLHPAFGGTSISGPSNAHAAPHTEENGSSESPRKRIRKQTFESGDQSADAIKMFGISTPVQSSVVIAPARRGRPPRSESRVPVSGIPRQQLTGGVYVDLDPAVPQAKPKRGRKKKEPAVIPTMTVARQGAMSVPPQWRSDQELREYHRLLSLKKADAQPWPKEEVKESTSMNTVNRYVDSPIDVCAHPDTEFSAMAHHFAAVAKARKEEMKKESLNQSKNIKVEEPGPSGASTSGTSEPKLTTKAAKKLMPITKAAQKEEVVPQKSPAKKTVDSLLNEEDRRAVSLLTMIREAHVKKALMPETKKAERKDNGEKLSEASLDYLRYLRDESCSQEISVLENRLLNQIVRGFSDGSSGKCGKEMSDFLNQLIVCEDYRMFESDYLDPRLIDASKEARHQMTRLMRKLTKTDDQYLWRFAALKMRRVLQMMDNFSREYTVKEEPSANVPSTSKASAPIAPDGLKPRKEPVFEVCERLCHAQEQFLHAFALSLQEKTSKTKKESTEKVAPLLLSTAAKGVPVNPPVQKNDDPISRVISEMLKTLQKREDDGLDLEKPKLTQEQQEKGRKERYLRRRMRRLVQLSHRIAKYLKERNKKREDSIKDEKDKPKCICPYEPADSISTRRIRKCPECCTLLKPVIMPDLKERSPDVMVDRQLLFREGASIELSTQLAKIDHEISKLLKIADPPLHQRLLEQQAMDAEADDNKKLTTWKAQRRLHEFFRTLPKYLAREGECIPGLKSICKPNTQCLPLNDHVVEVPPPAFVNKMLGPLSPFWRGPFSERSFPNHYVSRSGVKLRERDESFRPLIFPTPPLRENLYFVTSYDRKRKEWAETCIRKRDNWLRRLLDQVPKEVAKKEEHKAPGKGNSIDPDCLSDRSDDVSDAESDWSDEVEYVPENVEPISRRRLAFGKLDGLRSVDDDLDSTLDSNSPELNDDVPLHYLPQSSSLMFSPSQTVKIHPQGTSTPIKTTEEDKKVKEETEANKKTEEEIDAELNGSGADVKVETAESTASDATIPMDISKASSADESVMGSPTKVAEKTTGPNKKRRSKKHKRGRAPVVCPPRRGFRFSLADDDIIEVKKEVEENSEENTEKKDIDTESVDVPKGKNEIALRIEASLRDHMLSMKELYAGYIHYMEQADDRLQQSALLHRSNGTVGARKKEAAAKK